MVANVGVSLKFTQTGSGKVPEKSTIPSENWRLALTKVKPIADADLENKITPATTEIYIADFSQTKEFILLFIKVINLFLRNMV
jgi:hypothetical protein